MKASTHTEIYRAFEGTLAARGWRGLALTKTGLRTALRRRWVLLLYAPPLIATVIFSFFVYAKFALESGANPMPGAHESGPSPLSAMGGMAGNLIQVRDMIVGFHAAMNFWVLLSVAWFGSGLIAEDVRHKAYLLYFARPLSRLDYATGKFLVVLTLAAISSLVPGIVICAIAAWNSPDWSFVTQQGDVILMMLVYSAVSLLVLCSIALAISSLCRRRTHALAATLGLFSLTAAAGVLLSALNRDSDWDLVSIFGCFRRLAAGLFELKRLHGLRVQGDATGAVWVLVGWVVLAWLVIQWRTRRMEVGG